MMLRTLFVGLLLAGSCLAATVDGQWKGSVATPNGDSPMNFSFQSSGSTLTGTNTTRVGEAKITNGMIAGDTITFTVDIDAGGMPLTLSYRGVVAQDQIRFTLDVMGMPMEFVATRVSPSATPSAATAAAKPSAPSAGGVSGKWAGTLATPGGDFPVGFTFAADGAKLTGSTTGPEGDIQITNGKVDGDKITFVVSFDFGGMPLTMNYAGVVAKDEIKFSIDVFGMPMDATVTRVN